MDRLEAELAGQLTIIRINVQDEVGRELARVYGFRFTPTFIFFDSRGIEQWRQVGGLDTDRVRASLK